MGERPSIGRSDPELVLLPDVDHFFHGRLTLLRDTVVGRVLPPEPR
jgi:alpha/beta superfamily hydrolase